MPDPETSVGIFTDWQSHLFWLLVGVVGSLLGFSIRHHFTKTRRQLTCKRTFCDNLNLEDNYESPFAMIHYTIRNSGNSVVNNIKVVAEVYGDDRIEDYDWFVEKDKYIQCDRLDDQSRELHIQNNNTLVESTWTHLNAEDVIELVLHVAPGDDPSTIRLEVDATDAKISDSEMTSNCNIPDGKRLH